MQNWARKLKVFRAEHRAILSLLAVAWALRIALNLTGGQLFWPDENRFPQTFRILYNLARGDFPGAVDTLVAIGPHIGFIIVWLPGAALHSLFVLASGMPSVWTSFLATIWFTGSVLSLASVCSIGLVYALSRELQADKQEALLAAFLMACSTSMLIYARHLFPYDTSIALALFGFWLTLRRKPSFAYSLVCGFVLGMAFWTYYGYWPVVMVLAGFHAFYRVESPKDLAQRCIAMAAAASSVFIVLQLLCLWRGQMPYDQRLKLFLDENLHGSFGHHAGDYSEGWSLPWAYLWHAEHGLLLFWAAGVAVAVRACLTLKTRRRGLLWLGLLAGLYGLLSLSSAGLHLFMMSGRLVRGLIPFLCLSAAFGFRQLALRRPDLGRFRFLVLAALLLQCGYNFAAPFRQRFPGDIRRQVQIKYGRVSHANSIVGSWWEEADEPSLPYVLVNAQFFFPLLGSKPFPEGREIFRLSHPLEYIPFHYESFQPAFRRMLRETDISIRLIDRSRLGPGS